MQMACGALLGKGAELKQLSKVAVMLLMVCMVWWSEEGEVYFWFLGMLRVSGATATGADDMCKQCYCIAAKRGSIRDIFCAFAVAVRSGRILGTFAAGQDI